MACLAAMGAMVVAGLWRSSLVPTDPWHYVQGALAFPGADLAPGGDDALGFVLPIIPFAHCGGTRPRRTTQCRC